MAGSSLACRRFSGSLSSSFSRSGEPDHVRFDHAFSTGTPRRFASASAMRDASARVIRTPRGCAALKYGISTNSASNPAAQNRYGAYRFMDWLMITAPAGSLCLRSCGDRVSLYTATMSQRDRETATRAAGYALAVLTFINLFNYLDHWVLSA